MTNPLLETFDLPPFSQIKPEHAVPAITQILADNRQTIAELLQPGKTYSWDTLAEPLENLEDRLSKAFSPVGHLNSVVNSDELREAYKSHQTNHCLLDRHYHPSKYPSHCQNFMRVPALSC